MKVKRKIAGDLQASGKLGRPEELKIDDLPKRFDQINSFLENYWGRVGLGLKKALELDDVKNVLNLVKDVEQVPSFTGHAKCLIFAATEEVTPEVLRTTRRRYNAAKELEERCWAAYHNSSSPAQQTEIGLQQAISQFELALDRFEFFFVLTIVADRLKIKDSMTNKTTLWQAVLAAQRETTALKDILNAQEAWFARNEVIKFARNRRYSKSLLNFSRVLAGLPEWGWFHSRRTCEAMSLKGDSTTPGKLFEIIDSVIRKTKPLSLSRVEKRIRRELLQPDIDPFLKGYIGPQWDYLEEAIRFCSGKQFKRSELAFKIMDRFIYHCERGKSTIEIELAKRNQLQTE